MAAAVAMDACLAVLIVSCGLEAAAAWRNAFFQAGFWRLPIFEAADRLPQVILPALLLSAWTSFLAAALRARVRAVSAAVVVATFSAAAGWVGWAFLARLARSSFAPTGLLAPVVDGSAEFGRWGWPTLGVILAGLVLARTARVPATRAGHRMRRAAVVGAALFVALFLAAAAVAHVTAAAPASRPNVLFIVLDTVSARHMAPFGYRRVTTPEVDALAARGTWFTRAFAPAPWTLPSHASMFTGFAPVRHGATQEKLRLEFESDTLAEILRDSGYQTFAAVGNPVVGRATQLHQGFAEFVDTWLPGVALRYGRAGRHPDVGAFAGFLDRRSSRRPFLAFLNFNEAHAPYRPPRPDAARFLPPGADAVQALAIDQSWPRYYAGLSHLSRDQFDRLNDLYDGELAFVSRAVADAIAELTRRGLLAQTLVIVTADHGENIGDHGHLDHVFNLYDTVLHVPLVIFGPGVPEGATVERPVLLTDLFSTVLAAAGVARRADGEGQDLRASPRPSAAATPLVAEYYFPRQALSLFEPGVLASGAGRLAPYLRRLRAVRDGRWKLIWGSDGRHELYDVESDPNEMVNLAPANPERVRELTALLNARLSRLAGRRFSMDDEPPPGAIRGFLSPDAATRDRLKSLGYVR